jgi:hypothetical protein
MCVYVIKDSCEPWILRPVLSSEEPRLQVGILVFYVSKLCALRAAYSSACASRPGTRGILEAVLLAFNMLFAGRSRETHLRASSAAMERARVRLVTSG